LSRVRARASDEALSERVARHDRLDLGAVLLPVARPDHRLARARRDRVAVRMALRGGDSAAALSPRHSAAVRDVALSGAGDRRAGAVGLRVRIGADRRSGVCDRRRGGRRGALRYFVPAAGPGLIGIMMCAPGVPGSIIQGLPLPFSAASRWLAVEMPSCSGVAFGTEITHSSLMRPGSSE